MTVGSLVKYKSKYAIGTLIGVVLEVCQQSEDWCPYRVRWIDHLSSQRDWYEINELELLS